MNKRLPILVVTAALASAACTVSIDGEAGSTSSSPSWSSAVPLPFTPTITERANDRNDGTPFEPCTAYSDSEVRTLGASPSSISDAAFSDSPNYRGCHWNSTNKAGQFSQTVGNERSLADYKTKQSFRPWRADMQISGRTVIWTTEDDDGCFASFMSQKAIVHSSYRTTSAGKPSPGLVEECRIAIAFATLAISKAP